MSFNKFSDQQALIPMMGRLVKEIRGIVAQEFKAHGIPLSKEQAIVLKMLCDKDGQAQHDLAAVTCRDKTSLTRLLATMERKGLIRRKQSKEDKRINLVFISTNGRKEFEKATPIILDIINKAIKGIDEKRIDQTKALLSDIYKNLNISHEE